MKKTLTAALAALTFGGAIAATAAPAEARGHGYHGGGYNSGSYYGGNRYNNNAGVAVAAGIVGLALGAALTSNSHPYYARPYNSGPYYGGGYAYAPPPAYRTCVSSRWVWDPYRREDVLVRSSYAC